LSLILVPALGEELLELIDHQDETRPTAVAASRIRSLAGSKPETARI
jgi:hypothetical protein